MPIAVPGHDFHGGIPRAYLLGMAIGRGAVLHRLALPRWPRRADHINASRPCKRPCLRILQRFPGAPDGRETCRYPTRSEERRVGKECGRTWKARGWTETKKKKN